MAYGSLSEPVTSSALSIFCSWDFFPHDAARSRAYRSGEDGLLGVCDRLGLMCTALALWNGQDAILKERMFGLTNREVMKGNILFF